MYVNYSSRPLTFFYTRSRLLGPVPTAKGLQQLQLWELKEGAPLGLLYGLLPAVKFALGGAI